MSRKFVRYDIPLFETYEITVDELRTIEQGYRQVGEDRALSHMGFSAALTLLAALLAGTFGAIIFAVFVFFIGLFLAVAAYGAFRYRKTRPRVQVRISDLELRLEHGAPSLLLKATTLPRKAGHDGIEGFPWPVLVVR